ncbi:polysaccharide deacetylase family sporulation protein PdaB [Fimbriimonas ginsengisoli Gsoil 348]|uniref:Polysaccharide deacetylase family sporulation protein PdaB n=2 Tax=Fimbriimonas ginsengisoli TaxID=1005039 RepID=A0A068NW92_FIMGI|nr:polysaccharide deacetylase family sporulation protein PdaB [Fimbriimonas ginsengisoli Gsoil 348]
MPLLLASMSVAFGQSVQSGDRWQAAKLLDQAGKAVEWRAGRVTVFSFCAYWCDTWKAQVPKLVEVKGALRGLPVDIRTVSIDGRWAEVARNNGGLPLWRDAGAAWSRHVGVDRVPTTVVVDRTGRVSFSSSGIVRRDDLLAAVRSALRGDEASGGTVYLTFDDFPPANGGEELLDALRATGVKATLFCLGSRIEANVKLLRRALREGHSVQCHSWSHDASSPQLDRCHEAFRRALGRDFRLYRAPGSEQIMGLGQPPPVVDPYDYTRPGTSELLRRVLSAVRAGSEIQLHAGVRETVEALPTLVQRLRDRGFQFSSL